MRDEKVQKHRRTINNKGNRQRLQTNFEHDQIDKRHIVKERDLLGQKNKALQKAVLSNKDVLLKQTTECCKASTATKEV